MYILLFDCKCKIEVLKVPHSWKLCPDYMKFKILTDMIYMSAYCLSVVQCACWIISLSGFVDLYTLFVHFLYNVYDAFSATECTLGYVRWCYGWEWRVPSGICGSDTHDDCPLSTDSIFKEIRSKIGVEHNDEVRFDTLNQRSVPRERLSEWLLGYWIFGLYWFSHFISGFI